VKAKNLLRMFAMLALASAFPGLALSQALKTAIVGTWSVASVVDQYDSGQKVNNWAISSSRRTAASARSSSAMRSRR
jgi:antibiotic biosynthesis monooxygenase (ABM) superfamily enzyme